MKVGFLDESEGIRSSTRLICVSGQYVVMGLMIFLVITKAATPMEVAGFGSLLIAAYGGTKFFTTKNNKNKQPINKESVNG